MKRFTRLLPCLLLLSMAVPALAQDAEKPPKKPESVQILNDIEYAKVGDISLKLDLRLPTDVAGPFPVIVYIHGGGWSSGNKSSNRATRFATKGFAVASIDYRPSGQAVFPAQLEDCKAAIRFLRANAEKYGLDANHIGAFGHSAGGHLAAMLGTTGGIEELEGTGGNPDQSSRVQAVVDWSGPADLLKLYEGAAANRTGSGAVKGLLGGPADEKKELAALASPITHVSKDDAPFLVMHGEVDSIVPVDQGKAMHEALLKAGVQSTWKSYPGAEHAFDKEAGAYEMVEAFFDLHLKGKGVAAMQPTTRPSNAAK
jgi:acetyl esterase/lipase